MVTSSGVTRYAPYYCEENAWWLAQEPGLEHAQVIVITNRTRSVAMHAQRASEEGAPVVWDYHVVLAVDGAIWDLDCTLGMPISAQAWIDASFDPRVPDRFAPRFRIVDRELYVSRFASDRRHMRREDGGWHVPPPPWNVIGGGAHELDHWIDVDDERLGPWIDRTALLARLTSRETPASRPT